MSNITTFNIFTKDTFMSDCKVEKAKLQEMLREKKLSYENQHQTLLSISKSSEDKLQTQIQGTVRVRKKSKRGWQKT